MANEGLGNGILSDFNPNKLQVTLSPDLSADKMLPRRYTLTHSDSTGDLFLTIAPDYNLSQVSGWYTRFMRDEVFAEWRRYQAYSLHVHCHVSGGFVFGTPGFRYNIFCQHLPLVLTALRYGDRDFIQNWPELDNAKIYVEFHAKQPHYNMIKSYGALQDYRYQSTGLGE